MVRPCLMYLPYEYITHTGGGIILIVKIFLLTVCYVWVWRATTQTNRRKTRSVVINCARQSSMHTVSILYHVYDINI